MLDVSLLTADSARWLCTECYAEGRGAEPDACPYCHSDTVFASGEYGTDQRAMREILHELMEMIADARRWSYLQ